MNTAHTTTQIYQQILQDAQTCEALLALLQEEREALRERDMDALERIVQNKAVQLELLETSANKRSDIARAYAAGEDQEIWHTLLSELDDPALSESWQRLKALLHTCKLENEVNGKLLTRNHQIYSRLLDIVRGQTAAPSLYNASGSAKTAGGTNIVGEA